MSNNSILKSGSIGKPKVNDSSFKTLSRMLDTKLDRNITDDISLNNNRITNVKLPINDNDVATKEYCQDIKKETILAAVQLATLHIEDTVEPVLNSKLSKKGDSMAGSLDMNNNRIVNIAYPVNNYDCATKIYCDSITKTFNRNIVENLIQAEIDLETLCRAGEQISIILNRHNKINDFNSLVQISNNFLISLSGSISMYNKYKSMSEINARNIQEISNCNMFADLKLNVVKIIENLSRDMFYELKDELKIDTVEKRGVIKRYKRFLNKCAEDKYPNGISEKLQLLFDKNLMLMDLGFIYFMDSLLNYLLAS